MIQEPHDVDFVAMELVDGTSLADRYFVFDQTVLCGDIWLMTL